MKADFKKLYYDLADCIARESNSPEHLKFLARRLRKENDELKAGKNRERGIDAR